MGDLRIEPTGATLGATVTGVRLAEQSDDDWRAILETLFLASVPGRRSRSSVGKAAHSLRNRRCCCGALRTLRKGSEHRRHLPASSAADGSGKLRAPCIRFSCGFRPVT